MHGKLALLHRMGGVHRVRSVRQKVPANGKKYLDLLLEHRMQRLNGVISPLLRRIELELLCERIQEGLWWTLPDTHCAVALHIRVSAYTHCPSSLPTDITAHQQQVDDHRDVIHAIALLGHTEAPSADRLL